LTRYVFDIETDGLLHELTGIHCLVLQNIDTGELISCTDRAPGYTSISRGLELLAEADLIVGHNVITFDIPAIKKIHPGWKPRGRVLDTLVMTRLMWPREVLRETDFKLQKSGKLPGQLIGSFKLEAWGYRLGNYKGDYPGPWDKWSVQMQEYCDQDVRVTLDLLKRCEARQWAPESIELEHEVQWVVARQERHGFAFDQEVAGRLFAILTQRKTELEQALQDAFPPWVVETPFIPKVNNKKIGYVKGEVFIKRKIVHFNPASRDHIAHILKDKYNWEPQEFTKDGKPKLDDEVMSSLPYAEAKILAEYLMVEKRLGQIATGKEAWLNHVAWDGRIHGGVITNGAVTGRMTHSKPNIAQVPGLVDKKTGQPMPYGKECRDCFIAGPGKILVGCDADALELRCLAGYMAKHDGGSYIKTVLEGKKELGTDMHTVNAKALGCSRDQAKVWFYAFIYGAGDFKLGTILNAPEGEEREWGSRSRARFLKNLPALGKITKQVKNRVEGVIIDPQTKRRLQPVEAKLKGVPIPPTWLKGLDGRQLRCRSSHSSFNTLLQSAGAILMKKALVILDTQLSGVLPSVIGTRGPEAATRFTPGRDYEYIANVHDEWQIEVEKEIADDVGREAADAIKAAGVAYKFPCPLAGNYAKGRSWADTH
jgi:DNA polymerase-1